MHGPNLLKTPRTQSEWGRLLFIFTIILAALFATLSPLKVGMVIVGIIALLAAVKRPETLLLTLAIIFPLEPFILKFIPDDIYIFARFFSEGLIYLLAAVVVARVISGRTKVPRTPLDLSFVLFLIVLAASAAINLVPPTAAVLGARQILRFVVLFYTVVALAPSEKVMKKTLAIMLWIVLLESALGIAQYAAGGALDPLLIPSERKFFESIQLTTGTVPFFEAGTRVFATMGRYDQLGTFLALFLLLAVGFLYEKLRAQDQKFFYAILALGLPALLFTFSRASWFGFLLGLITIGVVVKRDRRVMMLVGGFAAAAFLYLAVTGIAVKTLVEYPGQTFTERFFESFSYERFRGEYFGLGRVFFFVQTPATVVASSPLFGVGPGQYGGGAAAALGRSIKYEELGLPFGVFGTEGFIDNNWFSLWGETGTLGLIFYLGMFWALLQTARRVYRRSEEPWQRGLALGFIGVLVAITFQAFLGTYLEVRTLAFYFWLFGAYLVILDQKHHRRIPESSRI